MLRPPGPGVMERQRSLRRSAGAWQGGHAQTAARRDSCGPGCGASAGSVVVVVVAWQGGHETPGRGDSDLVQAVVEWGQHASKAEAAVAVCGDRSRAAAGGAEAMRWAVEASTPPPFGPAGRG